MPRLGTRWEGGVTGEQADSSLRTRGHGVRRHVGSAQTSRTASDEAQSSVGVSQSTVCVHVCVRVARAHSIACRCRKFKIMTKIPPCGECYMILVGAERIYVRINRQRHLEVCADGLLHSAGDAQCCSDQSSLSASICLTGRREGTLTEQTRWKQM